VTGGTKLKTRSCSYTVSNKVSKVTFFTDWSATLFAAKACWHKTASITNPESAKYSNSLLKKLA